MWGYLVHLALNHPAREGTSLGVLELRMLASEVLRQINVLYRFVHYVEGRFYSLVLRQSGCLDFGAFLDLVC